MAKKQKQKQKQSQRQTVNITLGSTRPRRKYAKRSKAPEAPRSPIYMYTQPQIINYPPTSSLLPENRPPIQSAPRSSAVISSPSPLPVSVPPNIFVAPPVSNPLPAVAVYPDGGLSELVGVDASLPVRLGDPVEVSDIRGRAPAIEGGGEELVSPPAPIGAEFLAEERPTVEPFGTPLPATSLFPSRVRRAQSAPEVRDIFYDAPDFEPEERPVAPVAERPVAPVAERPVAPVAERPVGLEKPIPSTNVIKVGGRLIDAATGKLASPEQKRIRKQQQDKLRSIQKAREPVGTAPLDLGAFAESRGFSPRSPLSPTGSPVTATKKPFRFQGEPEEEPEEGLERER